MVSFINISSFGGQKIKSLEIQDMKPGLGHSTTIMEGGVGYDYVKAIVKSELGKGLNVKYTVKY